MRRLSDEARELLRAATAVARFRGAQECDTSDLKIAGVLTDLHPGVTLYPDATRSTSPHQLPLAAALEQVLTKSQDELGVEELRQLAADR